MVEKFLHNFLRKSGRRVFWIWQVKLVLGRRFGGSLCEA